MQEHHLPITYKARYYTHGELSSKTRQIWFALHGYGQLAKYFIRKFDQLNPESHYVIAPEGTNRFYLKGFDGRVGATWMTREDREADIENYINYLNQLYDTCLSGINKKDVKVNILGFSQGVATISRWVANGHIDADRIICWAGILPPDLRIEEASKVLETKKLLVVLGKDDPYINEKRVAEMHRISKQLKLNPEELWYEGDHSIDKNILSKIATSY